MKITFNLSTITKLYFDSNNLLYAVLVNEDGKIISNAPIGTVLNIIEIKRLMLINEEEILELLNLLYGIDYSKYGKLNARNI